MNKCFFLLLLPLIALGQQAPEYDKLFSTYEEFKEKSLEHRRIKHKEIKTLIDQLKKEPGFDVQTLGRSIQGREIFMVSVGRGETDVLLWSQMHGDEPTATQAMFDVFNYLKVHKETIDGLRVHFIPMLNPDGAQVFKRRNAMGIDINRDALRLQSPESRILKSARDSLEAVFGFNLHDQSRYYNTETSPRPATLSFLAPAFNRKKEVNDVRSRAMKVIVQMNELLQQYIPGQVGRYSDEFEPRAFGDNMQKWGTSTILIESGGYENDREKQFIRKLNYASILSALHSISTKSYQPVDLKRYADIPRNDSKLFDLKIENLSVPYLGKEYLVDLGIRYVEMENNDHTDFYYVGKVSDIGDLSTYFGYETLDASGLEFKTGETYPKILEEYDDFSSLDVKALLSQGYTSVSITDLPEEIKFIEQPINILDIKKVMVPKSNAIPQAPIGFQKNPTFLLLQNKEVVYAVINGFVYDIRNDENRVKNGRVE